MTDSLTPAQISAVSAFHSSGRVAQASSSWRPGRPSQVVAYAKAYRSGRSTNEGQRGRSQPTGRSSAGRQELGATQQPFTPSTCSACRHWQASFGSSPRSSMII